MEVLNDAIIIINNMMRVAIVHDSIRYFGGAERVLVALHRVFPHADIYTSVVCWEELGQFRKTIAKLNPRTSFFQHIPWFRYYPFLFRYILPFLWRSFDFAGYDLAISSSGAQMSHLITPPASAVHVCYSLTPPRHLYGYATDFPWQKYVLLRWTGKIGNAILRHFDFKAAQRVDAFIADSREVAARIHVFYRRRAAVIYPPISTFPSGSVRRNNSRVTQYVLVVSRLSPMKHVDLIIQACRLTGNKLYIVGVGPDKKRLQQLANTKAMFLGQVSDRRLSELYTGCQMVICAAEDEDFGIVPVEAMSYGKPVVAYNSGGYKETVIEGKTGIFFHTLTVSSLVNAIRKLEMITIDPQSCIDRAKVFSFAKFRSAIKHVVAQQIIINRQNFS